jgi:hypothetical protein
MALTSLSSAWLAACDEAPAGPICTPDASIELYQRRIEPILKDDHPRSCNQCHLAGIDLSLFVKDTPCQTMACMEKLGLVDLAQPEASKVLSWIGRAKPESTLITADVIAKEHAAFLEWIRYSASCGKQVCATYDDPCGQNQADASTVCDIASDAGVDYVDPGDCKELTLEQLFSADVYKWRGRCYPCHFASDKSVAAAQKWISDVDTSLTVSGAACASGSLATMRTALRLGLVDLNTPTQSLLLLKPLGQGGVPHGGGEKFDGAEDATYQSFLHWVDRYSACAAQDATLSKAGPPPAAGATPVMTDPSDSIYSYCNCMLLNCHDPSHAKWGAADDALIAGCRVEALGLPSYGSSVMAGNFLECRVTYCRQAAGDPRMCDSALGGNFCQ